MGEERLLWFEQISHNRWEGFLKGIEKEGLRVDRNGFIAQTPHPRALGATLTHPYITTDYSEALLELITPVCRSSGELLQWLRTIHTYVQMHLGDEVLWAGSMPCRLDGDASIPIAEYGTSNIGRLKEVYREGLAVRYGRMMQSIAGVHYNFSLPDSFWEDWQRQLEDIQSLQDFKSRQYFWLIRNFRRRSWLLMYLFGASPALDVSFVAGRKHGLARWNDDSWFGPQATSLRMGDLGYHNNAQASLDICFNRLDTYLRTLDRAIHTPWPAYQRIGVQKNGRFVQINANVLQIENEYYSAIRPKRTTQTGEKPIHALRSRGVEYIEVRCLDLNPFEPLGVTETEVDFLDLFLLDCLLRDSPTIDDDECALLDQAYDAVVNQGRAEALELVVSDGAGRVRDLGRRLLESLGPLAECLDGLQGGQAYGHALQAQMHKIQDVQATPSARVLEAMHDGRQGHVEWQLAMSREHQHRLCSNGLPPEKLEELRRLAARSLAERDELEAADTLEFSEFLARYQMT